MSEKSLRELYFVAAFISTAMSLLLFVALFVGIGHYSVTSIGVRWMALVAGLAAESVAIIWFAARINQNDPESRKWLTNGALLAAMSIAILFAPLGLEAANGMLDQTSRRMTVRIHSGGSLAGLEAIVVNDWDKPDKTRTIFWSNRVPSTSVRSGDCLTAIVGDGFLGLSWISDASVGACPGSNQAP
jgi:hypothetical protein